MLLPLSSINCHIFFHATCLTSPSPPLCCLKNDPRKLAIAARFRKETALVELNGGQTLIGSITAAVQKVKTAKTMIHSGVSLEEALEKVEATLDELVMDFAGALEQASQRDQEAA